MVSRTQGFEPALARLRPSEGESPDAEIRSRSLVVLGSKREPGTGVWIRESTAQRKVLTSIREDAYLAELWGNDREYFRLAPDNPFLSPERMKQLDSKGLVEVGSVVEEGDLLASVVAVQKFIPEKISVPDGMQLVCDDSLEVGIGWGGTTVTNVRYRTQPDLGHDMPRNVLGVVEVWLRREDDLAAGDLLLCDGEALGLVSRIVPDAQMPTDDQGNKVDAILDADATELLDLEHGQATQMLVGKADETASDIEHARAFGPYSLVGGQPLMAKKRQGGQSVTASQIDWLHSRSMHANVSELSCLKSDDLLNRDAFRRAIESKGSVPAPGTPQSLHSLVTYLRGLGLATSVSWKDRHVSLSVAPSSTDALLSRSSGELKHSETILERTYQPVEGGVFCPRVFGPENSPRRVRFGHIKLAAPFVPITWRLGTPTALERLLGLHREEIEQLVLCECRAFVREDKVHVEPLTEDETSTQDTDGEDLGTGAEAIRKLLARRSKNDVPRELRDCIPGIVQEAVLVIPADYRPLIPLDNGTFATSDLNDLYRRVIHVNQRLGKLMELQAPEAIITGEKRYLQDACDQLIGNMVLPEDRACFSESRPTIRLRCLLTHLALVCLDSDAKRVDFSGVSRVVLDPDMPKDRVGVSQKVFKELLLHEDQPVLLTNPDDIAGAFVALLPSPRSESVVRLSPDSFAKLSLAEAIDGRVILHQPLGDEARTEARTMTSEYPEATQPPGSPSGWTDAKTAEGVAEGLAASLTEGSSVCFGSPRGILLAGQSKPDMDAEMPNQEGGFDIPCVDAIAERRFKCVPAPAGQLGSDRIVGREQIREVVETHRRKVCTFEPVWLEAEPKPHQGGWGMPAWLPEDFDWPHRNGKPLQCVAQYPVMEGCVPKALGTFVSPNSLLTVFWHDSWLEQYGKAPVVVVDLDARLKLYRGPGEPVEGDHFVDGVKKWRGLKPVLAEEVPCWQEMEEILRVALNDPDPAELEAFRDSEWSAYPVARDVPKIGGWPAWIQGVGDTSLLIAQVPSDPEGDLMFGDMGSLYVFGVGSTGFVVHMQYH